MYRIFWAPALPVPKTSHLVSNQLVFFCCYQYPTARGPTWLWTLSQIFHLPQVIPSSGWKLNSSPRCSTFFLCQVCCQLHAKPALSFYTSSSYMDFLST
ncbi:hypothetical protein GDO81_005799 [Engystomops pustulosus]|uniref:Uncharacterized protein n=1 Tax=Engystomops pustulosus TaxID=76066 RepID=A0AAV7CRU5_ENGPU|nr:hypothetical protein GDO81_005799 [Engystomops pustulosus]